MVSAGRWSVLRSAWMVAVLALSGCVVESAGSDPDADLVDLAPPTLLADAEVEEPDMAEADGGMEADGGDVIPDGGSMDAEAADMATPDMRPPPDMMMALTIDSCEAACDRYTECDRLGDRFGEEFQAVRARKGQLPVIGFPSLGEVAPRRLADGSYSDSMFHNVSFVMALIGAAAGEQAAGKADPKKT